MPAALLLILAGAILVTAVAYALGWWVRATTAEADLRDLAEIHQVELDEAFQRGRRYGWHEPHACGGQCFNAAVTHLTQRTTTTPELN